MRINKYLKLNILILISIILGAAPVQAQEVVSNAGFHPQELLRNALQWVDNLGAITPREKLDQLGQSSPDIGLSR